MIIIVRNISWCYLQHNNLLQHYCYLHSCSPASITSHYLSLRLDNPIWWRGEGEGGRWKQINDISQKLPSSPGGRAEFRCCLTLTVVVKMRVLASQSVSHCPTSPTPPHPAQTVTQGHLAIHLWCLAHLSPDNHQLLLKLVYFYWLSDWFAK